MAPATLLTPVILSDTEQRRREVKSKDPETAFLTMPLQGVLTSICPFLPSSSPLHRHHFPSPVGARWMGSCEVPDLDLFPRRYPSLQTVTFHAGFASGIGHLLVWCLSGMVRTGLIRSLVPVALPLNRMSHWIEPVVSDKGAMFVRMQGIGSDGRPLQKTWNLLAARNHGPHIPCGASIALARKLARGEPLRKGAMPCMGLLGVEEYLAPLRDLDIREVEE